ncbi:30966_t:CDS:2 [Gigaspora margarita]|uniref:30966_t:CDS:1 n=1 Tax=Gigaspora margarita TaxID=4874 RepID=A0ABN7TZM0_GIGMA|nr:30966_t:CDS:2 [Gigaspora margarita]
MQNSEVVWEFTVEEKNKIGEGAFSIVYKCYSKTLKKDVALKSLKSYYDKDTVDYNKEFNREWLDQLKMAKEIASGIFHLHNKGIVHRDLHDKNVLVHDIAIHVINNGRETSIPGTPDDFVNLYKKAWHSEPEERPTIEKICLELDIQLYPKQIARGLNSLSCYNCSLEDRAYFTVRFFGGLVQDENFTKFVRQSVQTFFQGLKGLSQEEGAVRLEESRQEFVAANKVVKVIWFLVAAALEIAVISANFYFLDAVSVVLNCFSAIITFIAIAIRRENVATFAVEGIFVALKLLFMNMIPLTILFAAGNVAFAFYVFKTNNATISNLIETINVEIFEKYNLWKNAKIFEAENNALKVENYALKYELSNLKTRYNDLEKDITNLKEKYVASNERKIILESQETEFKS